MFGKQKDPSRTEEATPRREQKMRNEGNVPRSQELPRMVSLYGGMALITAWIGTIQEGMLALFRRFHGGRFRRPGAGAHLRRKAGGQVR